MSTHQQSKFCRAKKSITEESGRPGTCRSKVGCAAMDEPCTNRMVPAVVFGSPAHFSNRKSFTPPSLAVQCSSALMAAVAEVATSFILSPVGQRRRHCERSEAIQCCDVGAGLLRRSAPRNDAIN